MSSVAAMTAFSALAPLTMIPLAIVALGEVDLDVGHA
jgi:hypothetical protein